MNYYELINGEISQWNNQACRSHWQNCNETSENIIGLEGRFLLESEYVTYLQSDEHAKKQRLEQIEIELKNVDLVFAQKVEIIKEYNGKPYKVRYANDYQTLVLPSFSNTTETKDIWDATEMACELMNKSAVKALYDVLKVDFEQAFQDRKSARALLLTEKQELLEG